VMVVGGGEWWVANIMCQFYVRVLWAISYSSNPCSMATV